MTGWAWDASISPDWPVVADVNPGGKAVLQITPSSTGAELSKANSPNHQGAGQNVLYNDMHVAFQTTPFCGAKDDTTKIVDNIYTRSTTVGPEKKKLEGDPIMGSSSGFGDAVMLPVVGYRPPAKGK